MPATLTADRNTNGTVDFTLNVNGKQTTFSGWWDDATPYGATTYDTEAFTSPSLGIDTVRLTGIPNRSDVIIHGGSIESSEGCLIINKNDREGMFKAITDAGLSLGDLTVDVRNDMAYQVSLSAAASVTEGKDITLTASLSGGAAVDGLERDVYVKVKLAGGARQFEDFNPAKARWPCQMDPGRLSRK